MYRVTIAKDDESGYFYVLDTDVIGLNACAPTLDEVVAICEDVIPDLIEANHRPGALARFVASLRAPRPQVHVNFSRDIQLAHAC